MWLIAVAACVLNDHEVNYSAIILQGEQNIGKSCWIKSLLPQALEDYLYTGNIISSDKDSKLAVVKNFLINLDELETLNREDIGFLKSLMTQKVLEIRKPYGHYEEVYIRRSSFIGSVNKKEFLSDMTGSRRFVCISVKEMNSDHGINMDKVFSQAKYLYKSATRYWFNKDEADDITSNNERFRIRSIEEEKILERFSPISRDESSALLLTCTEIAEKIFEGKVITNPMIRQIGMVLSKYRFERVNKKSGGMSQMKWIVKEMRKYESVTNNELF